MYTVGDKVYKDTEIDPKNIGTVIKIVRVKDKPKLNQVEFNGGDRPYTELIPDARLNPAD